MATVTTTPGILTPAYNPMYYNTYEISFSLAGFAWTSDLQITGSKNPAPETFADIVTKDLGSYIKQPTNDINQWWDPSRVVQTFLTYNFNPEVTCVESSGRECVARLTNTLSYQNINQDKSVAASPILTYVLNGGADRNVFRNQNTNDVGVTTTSRYFHYIPNIAEPDYARFLTDYNYREVDMYQTGTLSCLNGTFSGNTNQNTIASIVATTDSFDYTRYDKAGNVIDTWMLGNPYRNSKAFNTILNKPITDLNRVTIPAYPKNLTDGNQPWAFFDNNFVAGGFGMISTYPHNFKVGDVIHVSQDPGFVFNQYQGTHTIVNVPSPYIIGTSTPWAGSTPANGGSAILLSGASTGYDCTLYPTDNTELQYTAVTSDLNSCAVFHFTQDVQNVAPNSFFSTSATTGPYVTNGFGSKNSDQELAYPLMSADPFAVVTNMLFQGNDSGSAVMRQRMPSANQEFFDDNIDSYKIQFGYLDNVGGNNDWSSYGEGSTFKLKGKCGKHDRIELFWLNKLGAFDSMLFNGKNTKSIGFNKETYTKRLGNQADSPFIYDVINYNTEDFEKQNFNGYQDTFLTVSTGWINETDGDRVIECMGSNVVYMLKDGTYTPVIATVESVDVKTKANEKLIYYTISLELTYNRVSQRT